MLDIYEPPFPISAAAIISVLTVYTHTYLHRYDIFKFVEAMDPKVTLQFQPMQLDAMTYTLIHLSCKFTQSNLFPANTSANQQNE